MSKKVQRALTARLSVREIDKKIRKTQPPSSKIHRSKKRYRRRAKFLRFVENGE